MQYRILAVAITPIFFASTFAAYGQATVKNSCGDEAYFWSCGDSEGKKVTIAPGDSHSESYSTKSSGGGLSLKIATKYHSGEKAGEAPGSIYDLPQPNITQFEYTIGSPGPPTNQVWYDISNINGYPFVAGGLKMTSSDGSVSVACPKDVQYCQAAYNAPHDDHATGSAHESVELIMELCSDAPGIMAAGGSSSSSSSGSSSGGSSDSNPNAAPVVSSAAPIASSTQAAPLASSTQAAPQEQQQHQDQQQQQEQQTQSPRPTSEKVAEKPAAPVQASPSPATTPPPTNANEDPVIVWVTHTAQPEIVTKHIGPDGQSWDSKAKRDQHVHQHLHNKINKKRHGAN